MDTIWVCGHRPINAEQALPAVGGASPSSTGWSEPTPTFYAPNPISGCVVVADGGIEVLRRGMSVGLAERFRLGTGGCALHGERGLLGGLTWEGCCYGFLAAARRVSGTKEIRRKKPSPSTLLRGIYSMP